MIAGTNNLKIPFYAKVVVLLLGLLALLTLLYLARAVFIPLAFSVIIAIVLHPVVNFFERLKINRILAIIMTLFLTFLVIAALGALFISQANRFTESWPLLVDKFTEMLNQTVTWASGYFNLDPQKIHAWIAETKSEIINTSGAGIGQTILGIGSIVVVLFLVPVYVFMLLFYHPLLIDFIHKLFGEDNQSKVSKLITQTKTVVQRYLVGIIIETVIVAALEIITLFILGIEYAILLGIIGALLNLIPYIGGLVAVALPMIVALVTKSSGWYAIYVFAIYYFIQLIDNNFIVPKIVASKVKINALFSIIAVIIGNALWGIPGMFLSIPLLAIIKLIFDNIEQLKPWGFLLGDTMPPLLLIKPVFKKKSNKQA
jgi:predicted PurR-regulated permease PerM